MTAVLPLAGCFAVLPSGPESPRAEISTAQQEPETAESTTADSEHLIGDLAWILLLGAVATILFKKLRQPVVLGYILAGFLAGPKFVYLPSVVTVGNIDFWAELGIVVLMFTLGLEFSFKKLMKAGSEAVIPALVIIVGMTFAGFGVGKLLHFDLINCIFLGGMVSMSSTTIILKALTDLGLRQKRFASVVLAVLILEDLFAVVMLVILSSIAVGKVEGMALIMSIAKLVFFLVIWFVVGVYLLPQLFSRSRSYMNDETLLIISMGLCFGMAVFSVYCGFSLELGAFVMGSVLAGTMLAERIEKVVKPIKDLFGAVFFISVGMMVDPGVIAIYWSQILILAIVVIAGMILFGTLGMLLGGQPLKVAMESGFCLTQIGEFSFIIATLGMSLGVLSGEIYPVIVAVSVITIFTTPYFIKLSQPAYAFVEKRLPGSLSFLIDRYTHQGSDTGETRKLWRAVLSRFLTRVVLYSIIIIAIILSSRTWLQPLLFSLLNPSAARLLTVGITIACMAPFLGALLFASSSRTERMRLHSTAAFYDVPLVGMYVVRYVVVFMFIFFYVSLMYGAAIGWLVGAGVYVVIILLASTILRRQYKRMEKKFIDNLNVRENTRYGVNNTVVSDLHLAYIEVGPHSPFVGDRLQDSGLRRDYGVSVSSIQRGQRVLPLPTKESRIFPGDILGVIGTDEQIKKLNDDIADYEHKAEAIDMHAGNDKLDLVSVKLGSSSPLVGKSVAESRLSDEYHAMLVKIQRPDGEYVQPEPGTMLLPGDVVWLVGDPDIIEELRGGDNKGVFKKKNTD